MRWISLHKLALQAVNRSRSDIVSWVGELSILVDRCLLISIEVVPWRVPAQIILLSSIIESIQLEILINSRVSHSLEVLNFIVASLILRSVIALSPTIIPLSLLIEWSLIVISSTLLVMCMSHSKLSIWIWSSILSIVIVLISMASTYTVLSRAIVVTFGVALSSIILRVISSSVWKSGSLLSSRVRSYIKLVVSVERRDLATCGEVIKETISWFWFFIIFLFLFLWLFIFFWWGCSTF